MNRNTVGVLNPLKSVPKHGENRNIDDLLSIKDDANFSGRLGQTQRDAHSKVRLPLRANMMEHPQIEMERPRMRPGLEKVGTIVPKEII